MWNNGSLPAPVPDRGDVTVNDPARRPVRRRKSPGKLWSATSSIAWFDATGTQLARTLDTTTVPPGAVTAKVYYRVDGRSKKPTFRGPNLRGRVAGFQALLAAAYHGDWKADEYGRPLQPTPLPGSGASSASDRRGDQVSGSSAVIVDAGLFSGAPVATQGTPGTGHPPACRAPDPLKSAPTWPTWCAGIAGRPNQVESGAAAASALRSRSGSTATT